MVIKTELERLRETFEKLGGEDLGVLYQGLQGERESVAVKIGVIQQVLTKRLEDDEATELDAGSAGMWSLVPSYAWVPELLVELKEKLKPDELAEVWSAEEVVPVAAVAATTRTVPEAWNLRKMKGLRSKGKAIAAILDKARRVTSRKLDLVAKEEEGS